jgi:hypothetical protein
MAIELKEVLHHYAGIHIKHPDGSLATLVGVVSEIAHFIHDNTGSAGFCSIDSPLFGKIMLRHLQDISEEERDEFGQILNDFPLNTQEDCRKIDAAQTLYLLKQQFDLFGLIESGQALNKTHTTMKQ